MNLKNYTSEIPAGTTIAQIEAYLANLNVLGISKEYDACKQVRAITFHIDHKGKLYTIRLPANVQGVLDFLYKDYLRNTSKPRKKLDDFRDQASRTAWKTQKDWVEIQMSMVSLKQADLVEVFLPYIWDGEQTFFQRLDAGGMKQLAEKV